MSDDVVSEVRAAIQERREKAQRCEKVYPSPWDVSDRGWMAKVTADEPTFRIVCELNQDHVSTGTVDWLSDPLYHIAAWDPASVLRFCDGLDAILDLHGKEHECPQPSSAPSAFWYHGPCPTLLALASMLGVGETQ